MYVIPEDIGYIPLLLLLALEFTSLSWNLPCIPACLLNTLSPLVEGRASGDWNGWRTAGGGSGSGSDVKAAEHEALAWLRCSVYPPSMRIHPFNPQTVPWSSYSFHSNFILEVTEGEDVKNLPLTPASELLSQDLNPGWFECMGWITTLYSFSVAFWCPCIFCSCLSPSSNHSEFLK